MWAAGAGNQNSVGSRADRFSGDACPERRYGRRSLRSRSDRTGDRSDPVLPGVVHRGHQHLLREIRHRQVGKSFRAKFI